jgi:hypothetical protein
MTAQPDTPLEQRHYVLLRGECRYLSEGAALYSYDFGDDGHLFRVGKAMGPVVELLPVDPPSFFHDILLRPRDLEGRYMRLVESEVSS